MVGGMAQAGEGGPVAATFAAAEEPPGHLEAPDDPFIPVPREGRPTTPGVRVEINGQVSVQVNVDADGNNILGDAANEPSIAVDPNDSNRMAIGWRQFDTVASNFRQAGWGFTVDGGETWTFPGVLEPGVFRSDPILGSDSQGNFFYDSLGIPGGDFCTDTFKSVDGGQSWGLPVFSFGGDKAWMSVDQSGLIGDGHIYSFWTSFFSCGGAEQFNRSTDGGQSFETPVPIPNDPQWGVTAVGPEGEVYVGGRRSSSASQFLFAKSTSIRDPGAPLGFDFTADVDLGGSMTAGSGPNPGGLLGQVWVAADPTSVGPGLETVYMLSSVNPPGADPLDVHFVRSIYGGKSWSGPVRINDDPGTSAWQWFGTMSVAPDGRIDVIWNDTRNDPGGFDSELFYAFSGDGGLTWSPNEPLSPAWDPHIGWPQQNKIGDYYDMVSDLEGAHIAYAATFNGEQDVYYLRLRGALIFEDGFESGDTSAWSSSLP